MKISKKTLKAAGLLMILLVSFPIFSAESYPNKPIRMIVPYAPGGATDNLARKLGQLLQAKLGQSVLIDNKPGGGAIIGGQALTASPPDGYTIGVFDPAGLTVSPPLYKKPPYNALTAFQPIIRLVDNAQVLIVSPSSPIKTFSEFLTFAKANPGTPYGTAGAVGLPMLDFEKLSEMAGVKLTNAGYRGSAPVLQDIVAGQLQFAYSDVASAAQYIKTGKVKALAVGSKKRQDAFPDVPTFAELGYPQFESVAWFGVFAPAHTPSDVIQKLDQTLREIGNSTEFREWAASQSFTLAISPNPSVFVETMRQETIGYTKMARRLNVVID